ncbi:hypothetical protein AYI69_g6609 [Smittium culicis]|uniref:Uncharacterized protein n=1 Tax=Smittium culicis TaxID=133412 RepID=A0A1R1X2L3_9FUNG|nr:hypothetical protein AYI69_g10902 [Smittium culicis]OMJ19476.1 hypothetical protein AYI69_g6609 [Smittium culicis]
MDLTTCIDENPSDLFKSIYIYFNPDYSKAINSSQNLQFEFNLSIREKNENLSFDFIIKLEQLLWFGRAQFHSFSTKTFTKAILKFNNGIGYVERFLNRNFNLTQSDYTSDELSEIIIAENFQLNNLENLNNFAILSSYNVTNSESFEDFLIILAVLLSKQKDSLKIELGPEPIYSDLINTSISSLTCDIFSPNGIAGKALANIFDLQKQFSKNKVSFLTEISNSMSKMLQFVTIVSQDSPEYQKSYVLKFDLSFDIQIEFKKIYNIVPRLVALNSIFSVFSKGQISYFIACEKDHLRIGWDSAIRWFSLGMPSIHNTSNNIDDEFSFFASTASKILNTKSLSFNSISNFNSSQSKFSASAASTPVEENTFSFSDSQSISSTKLIKLFNFGDYSSKLESYKDHVIKHFLDIIGFTLISGNNSTHLQGANEFDSGDFAPTVETGVLISPSPAPQSEMETSNVDQTGQKDNDVPNSINIDSSSIGYSPISVPLCLSLLCFTNESIMFDEGDFLSGVSMEKKNLEMLIDDCVVSACGRLLPEADDIAAAEADAGVRPLRAAAGRGEQPDQVAEQVANNRLQRVHERDGQPAVRPAPEKHPQLQLHRARRVPAHRRPEPLLRLGAEQPRRRRRAAVLHHAQRPG